MTDDQIKRLLREYTELDERLVKMSIFMTTSHYADLEPVAQGLLGEQKAAMQHYHQVLKQRLDLMGHDMSQLRSYDHIDYMLEADDGIVTKHLGNFDIDRDGPPSFSA